jgi:hypothetical protein
MECLQDRIYSRQRHLVVISEVDHAHLQTAVEAPREQTLLRNPTTRHRVMNLQDILHLHRSHSRNFPQKRGLSISRTLHGLLQTQTSANTKRIQTECALPKSRPDLHVRRNLDPLLYRLKRRKIVRQFPNQGMRILR